ncbi:MAG: peptidoglycan glycosyltransferase [Parasporobacterium sp.]|nr:peptidoglycan glycosyltransferase [Parasporobacterium sp.]
MEQSKSKKKKKYTVSRRMKTKLTIVFVIAFILLFLLVVRLTWINLNKGDEYTLTVLEQTQSTNRNIAYKRGEILDRNKNTLATSTKIYNLVLDPKVILDNEKCVEPTLKAVSEVFGFTYEELLTKVNENADSNYVVMKKGMNYEEVQPFEEKQQENDFIRGVWFEENYKRKYPYSALASNVIGFTTSEGSGAIGLEAYYDEYLTGTNGREFTYTNDENVQETVIKKATDGNSIVTTLDSNVQSIVEKYIAQWQNEYHPKNIAVVIQNPNTGEIVAMADNTSVDLNDPRNLSAFYTPEELGAMTDEQTVDALNSIWRNYAVSEGFEPGSTFKPFTVAAAMEEGTATTADVYGCDGGEQLQEWYIGCHIRAGHGLLTLKEVIMQSCNDALMQINAKLGAEAFTKYREKFGFNEYTDIDLPSEVSCENIVHEAAKMDEADVATYSFGQNFKITMVQMTSAFSSIINGGYLYRPYLVKEIYNADGGVVETVEPTLVARTVSNDTSNFLKEALKDTVISGTGKKAAVDGYIISGKTGTAEKGDTEETNDYVLSFIGFAPYENPELVCYVIVDTPDVEDTDSSAYASRLFSAIMGEVLPYLNIMPDADESVAEGLSNNTVEDEGGAHNAR